MAQRAAIASGNWSNPAIWNGGVLPEPGDVVASNTFTVTIDQNINVDRITNTTTTVGSEVPIMTSNTTPSGIVTNTGSSNFTTYGQPFAAFDGSSSLFYAGVPAITDWVAYEFTSPKVIARFAVSFNGGYSANFALEAWDGSTWILIGTHNTTGGNTSPTFANTTAYIKYRLRFASVTAYTQVTEVAFYDALSIAATAGGTFILNSGVTVTTINGVSASNLTCLTYSGSGTSTIIGNINALTVTPATYTYTLVHSGAGTLNIIGSLYASFTCSNRGCLTFTGSGILNVTGNILAGFCNAINVDVSGTGTMNVVGYVEGGSNVTALNIGGNARVNITGNVGGGGNSGRGVTISGANTVTTITGNLVLGQGGGPALLINAAGNITVTGSVVDTTSAGVFSLVNTNSAGCYLKIIGTIYAGNGVPHVSSLGTGAINILTGPFISSPTGVQPIAVSRMHYQRTLGSYFEFRDNSTNGALAPAVSAPATRLVAPTTVVDAPIPSNVRFGISYALGSQIGTMKVPVAGAVMFGVAVDNTVGTALLSAAQVWNYLRNDISVSGSIGDRLKNCATVESTGSQIASFKSS